MEKVNMDRLKGLEFDIFEVFVDICEKNNLRYFMLGGSCLGAVRHKGFIPWDDDIDVGMPRSDYDRFMQIAQEYLPEGMFLQNYKTDSKIAMNFAKIRNSETAFIEKTVSHLDINHGVYIDIFPLDGYKHNKLWKLLFRFYKIKITTVYNMESKGKKYKFIEFLVNMLLPGSYIKYRDKLERLVRKNSYDECELVANLFGAWGDKEIMPRDIFGKGTVGEFERKSVVLPEKTHEYLTRMYGNYMQFPPEEKRVAHHYCTVIDLEKTYFEYTHKGDSK